VTRKNKIRNKN